MTEHVIYGLSVWKAVVISSVFRHGSCIGVKDMRYLIMAVSEQGTIRVVKQGKFMVALTCVRSKLV